MPATKKPRGGVIIDGAVHEFGIPKEFVQLYRDRPRVIVSKKEWYGIHPLPIEALLPELRSAAKGYKIIAVPEEML